MLSLYLIVWVAALALAAKVLQTVYRAASSPLRDLPGPLAARFTRLWYFKTVWDGQGHLENILIHRKYAKRGEFYAPIVRLGPNLFSITSPEKNVYGIGSKMPKSDWYQGWAHPDPERWNLFPDQNMERHARERRKFQSIYSMSSLLHYEPLAEDVQSIFRAKLSELADLGRPINMHHWLQCYAFDVIGSITYSRRFGFLDEGKDIDHIMKSLDALGIYGTLAGVYAWLHPYLYPLMERLPGSGANGRKYIMDFVRNRMAERQAERREKKETSEAVSTDQTRDFLDLVLDAEADPDNGMTEYNVFMIGLSNVIAGSDTTAGALSGILWHLTSYPETLAKLRAELDTAIAAGKMTKDGNVTFKESQTLPYLQACIKEGQRMTSSVGLPLWRVVPKGGAEIMGRYFPEGSEIGFNSWVAHYNKDVWGTDALQFRPDRWLEAAEDSERLRTMDANYAPFGLGSRTCIGRHISMLEMSKVVPMIVSQFDLHLLHPTKELHLSNYWFVKPIPDAFKVVVSRRNPAEK